MIVAMLVILLALCGLLAWFAIHDTAVKLPRTVKLPRPRRRPRELRGDWWPEFERQLRDYERRNAHRRHRPRHAQDWQQPPG